MCELSLNLRQATIVDCEMVFHWRNLPEIALLGSKQKTVDREEHTYWFQKIIKSKTNSLLIVQLNGKPIGQVRFDDVEKNSCAVSIYLLPQYTGKGLGVVALKDSCRSTFSKKPITRMIAMILKNNVRSLSAFQKAGFKFSDNIADNLPENHFLLELDRPPDVPHNRLTRGDSEEEALVEVVRSGYWASGPKVEQLEATLAGMANVKHAVCVASGLSALRLLILGLGVGPGDNILVPAYSCVALANAVLACDANPIPIDITPGDWNLDVIALKNAINELRPRAVIVVNTFGVPASVESMQVLDIPILEDCAHSFGMVMNGLPIGGRTQAAILSFYATKLIGAGEGGAVLTNSTDLAKFIKSWRDYSDQQPSGKRLNDKMTDIEAALALSQLERLPDMIAKRSKLARRYHDLLVGEETRTGLFRLPDISSPRIWYRYVVEMQDVSAQAVIDYLLHYGVQAQKPITDWRSPGIQSCPIATWAYDCLVSLPLYPTLKLDEQDRVVHAFLSFIQKNTQ